MAANKGRDEISAFISIMYEYILTHTLVSWGCDDVDTYVIAKSDDGLNERVATFLCGRIIIKSVNLPTAQYHLFLEIADDDRVRRWDYSPCPGF